MRHLLYLAAAALLSVAGPAGATDLYSNGAGSTKDAPSTPFLPVGAYISVGAGGSLTDTGITQSGFSGADFNFAGFLGEARFGYDIRPGGAGSPWIIGVFGGGSYEGLGGHVKGYSPESVTIVGKPTISVNGATAVPLTQALADQYVSAGGTIKAGVTATLNVPIGSSVTYTPSSYDTANTNQDWGWEAGVRVGRVFNNSSLLYGLVAYQGQQVSITGGPGTTLTGVKVGAGLEIDLKDHWFFGSEVDWVWYGDWNPAQQNVKFTEDELRATARLGYRF